MIEGWYYIIYGGKTEKTAGKTAEICAMLCHYHIRQTVKEFVSAPNNYAIINRKINATMAAGGAGAATRWLLLVETTTQRTCIVMAVIIYL